MTPKRLTLAAAVLGVAALPLLAETEMDHSGHMMTGAESASTLAYMEANMAMHEGMAIAFTGDADVDFVAGMIPHHQGAVEMAQDRAGTWQRPRGPQAGRRRDRRARGRNRLDDRLAGTARGCRRQLTAGGRRRRRQSQTTRRRSFPVAFRRAAAGGPS